MVDRIRIAIFRGDLKPGDQLPSEPELARQLAVGRSAVREAIRILESAGLLTVRRGHGGGTFVQERDVASLVPVFADILRLALVEVSELTRTRVLLETVVIQEAGARISPVDIAALNQNVDLATEYYHQGEVALRLATNLEFHMMLARIAASPVLELNVGAVLKLLSYYLETIPATSEMVDGTLAGHRQLVEYFAVGQVREAVELNREHIQTVSRKMIRRAEEDADKGLPARHLFDDGGIDEKAV
ncbi:MAG: GntR family transcriptional regulator [Proteobacteria bacterium]|nr:GntR family transcriptional regulator [Pseudomonadota bacterium]MBU4603324.1 GntR family transcriptional regulator [Pseudomonadota bacterium]